MGLHLHNTPVSTSILSLRDLGARALLLPVGAYPGVASTSLRQTGLQNTTKDLGGAVGHRISIRNLFYTFLSIPHLKFGSRRRRKREASVFLSFKHEPSVLPTITTKLSFRGGSEAGLHGRFKRLPWGSYAA